MPIWRPSFIPPGSTPCPLLSPSHDAGDDRSTADFLLHAGPLGDILPIPIPYIRNVASIGDLFLSAGLGFFLFATVLRPPPRRSRRKLGRPSEPHVGPAAYRQLSGSVTGRPTSAGASAETASPQGLERRVGPGAPGPARRIGRAVARRLVGDERAQAVVGPSDRRHDLRRPPRLRRSRESGATRSSGSPSTARSPPCGLASSSACSAIGSIRSRSTFLVLRRDELADRGGLRLRLRDAPEPVPLTDRGTPRRPLGPEGRHGRQRPAAGRLRPR